MPIDYKNYHPKWKLISKLIRFRRAHNRCEECGILNGTVIKRLKDGTFRTPGSQEWDMIHSRIRYSNSNMTESLKYHGFSKIVLTVAHLDHNINNNRFNNLKALCQMHHLKLDMSHHVKNRKYGRDWKRNQIQLEL